MTALSTVKSHADSIVEPVSRYLAQPVRVLTRYDRSNLRPDFVAGLTVAVILLPQAIAFALIAELPPQMGLYAAFVGAIFGALWGSSNHIHTGPTNAISLLVLSALLSTTVSGSEEFILAAGLLAVMAGFMQLVMGLARLGVLVNFVSHSVIVGFATGAGILIAIKQLRHLLGISVDSESNLELLYEVLRHLDETNIPTAALGIGAMVLIVGLRRFNRNIPGALVAMIVASAAVVLLGLREAGVSVIGEIPAALPPLVDFTRFTPDLVARLSTGALAVGAIGLVETVAISRSIATQTGQRLDSNQEFVGQGMANIAAGLFTGYPVAGSFSRSAVNFNSGAQSKMAAIFSAVFLLIAIFTVGSLAVFLPRTALAGVLILTAWNLIDRKEIRRIWSGSRGDAVIMVVTLAATLFLHIEFAVLIGILLSFAVYIMRTSAPRVHAVLPDAQFRHFVYQPDKPQCPQLGIVDVLGDLYFGAVNHVEEIILEHREDNPGQRFLLIRLHNVNNADFSGIHMLENIVRLYREDGGDVFVVRPSFRVLKVMKSTGFYDHLGADNILDEDKAIFHLFHRILDPAACIYECNVRAFRECQNLPKRDYEEVIPLREVLPADTAVQTVAPLVLWDLLRHKDDSPPLVLDVREPREYRRGHIPEAQSMPLPQILQSPPTVPEGSDVILVCRTGRRSRRAAQALRASGIERLAMLEGGMLAWEAAGLLEAVAWHPATGRDGNGSGGNGRRDPVDSAAHEASND